MEEVGFLLHVEGWVQSMQVNKKIVSLLLGGQGNQTHGVNNAMTY